MASNITIIQGPNILGGESLSESAALGTLFIVGVQMPQLWTPAMCSLVVSPDDGAHFFDLFDGTGREFTFNVTPGVLVVVNPYLMLPVTALKIRSGTRNLPVVQEGTRTFEIVATSKLAI